MKQKTAIVYDWIDTWGGVERILLILHEMFPEADFYTSYVDRQKASWAKPLSITTSFIQKLPRFIKQNRILSLPFYPYAFETFDFSAYDLVISVSSSFAKGIITKPQTTHITYLLTPTRYLWGQTGNYLNPSVARLVSPYLRGLKKWDRIAAMRPDHIAVISKTVSYRCKKYYDRTSTVIYPPFDHEYWNQFKNHVSPQDDYYLLVSRLEPYKKVDLAIGAFAKLPDKKLIVVGTGTLESKLKSKSGKNISFVSDITDGELAAYYSGAKALVMPQEEDFGYVSLEAQFFGAPVIAYRKGGATESVFDGKTGLFFDEQSVDSLASAIGKFDIISSKIKRSTLEQGKGQAMLFERKRFEKEFKDFVQSRIGKHFII